MAGWILVGMSCWIGVATTWIDVSAFDVGIELYNHGDVACLAAMVAKEDALLS